MDSKIKIILSVFLFLLTITINAQDKKVMKIAKYIEKGKGTEAKELLDELDSKKEYQSDIYYWYVRTVYYRNAALANTNSPSELAEARKSFEKLVEFDKTDPSKSFTQYIPQIRKDLYEGKNQSSKSSGGSSSIIQANDNGKTVTLTQIGQGKTKDAAKYNALRNAIEKAFGTFISSNTTLLNDELVKDEIVSVSTGNIQNFEILSETQMPDGSFSSVVKATVSIGNLTKFCESKGISVEFKGGLFAANIKLQELNKKNEEAVMANLFTVLNKISANCFDFTIEVNEPVKDNYSEFWNVNSRVIAKSNNNISQIKEILLSTIENISLSESELQSYRNSNIKSYPIVFKNKGTYYLRSPFSIIYIKTIIEKRIPINAVYFEISNGVNRATGIDLTDCFNNSSSKNCYFLPNKNYTRIPNNWKCLNSSKQDCGYYNNFIRSKYFLTYTDNNTPLTNDVSDFVMSLTTQNIEAKKNEYSSENNTSKYSSQTSQLIIDPNQLNSGEIEFLFSISNVYSIDQLSKVTEYKVQPIIN